MIHHWLKLFRQQYINITLNTSRELETRILETPGLWMETAELEQLRKDLITIASKTVSRGLLDYGVFAENGEAFKYSIITIVYEKDGKKPIAFNALAMIDLDLGNRIERVLHLGLVMVDPDARSQGLSWILYGLTCVFLFLRNQLRPVWVSNVTQVPAVVGMVSETFSEVFPSPGTENRCSLSHVLIARRIMENHRHVFGVGDDAKFDEKRFVITNAYTGGSDHLKKTFAKSTKHRRDVFNDYCKAELNYRRGDDVIQLGKIDLNATRRFLTESVPKGSLAGLAIAGIWVVLNRLALPVLYWADPTRQWHNLRPYKQ
ncbi:MAG: hypothetical protein AAGA76_01435 [Pseudomonadota bacterium]